MKKHLYRKPIDISNMKSMFNFLNGHYTYDTMNSWNGLKSIANLVKVHNLGLDGNCWNALAILEYEQYDEVNYIIHDWEREHPGYTVGFNGRSGGYLVLYNKDDNRNVLPSWISDYENYEDFKYDCRKYYSGTLKAAKRDMRFYAELVRDFDTLCDEIREVANAYSKLDPITHITEDRLELFNDEYYDELTETIKLDGNRINFTDDLKRSKSLLACLLTTLRHDLLKTTVKEDHILVEAC